MSQFFNNSTDDYHDDDNFTHHSKISNQHGGIFSGCGPLDSPLARFLVQAIIIIGLSRLLHCFLQKLYQPRVIAEIIGGICLGPSVLGMIPGFTTTLFPDDSLALLTTVSNIGLVFYLFLVGLEVELGVFFHNWRRSTAISIAGIAFPFALGAAASWGMYNNLLVPNVNNTPFISFVLFTGVAMSITAFPVLARILTEKKLLKTPVGAIVIAAAAVDDVTAWTLLALVISIINASNNMTVLYVCLVAVVYALILLCGVRRLLKYIFDNYLSKRPKPVNQLVIALIFMCIFFSAWITEIIGIHAIFGAFLFGLSLPRRCNVVAILTEKVESVVIIGFLPLFFASSGLKTNFGLLNDALTWAWLFGVLVVACGGKIFGCTATAKLMGVPWREAFSVGILMNTKGLVELIVLNVGYDAKIINGRIFLIMVIMALVTTFITSPVITFLYPPRYHTPDTEHIVRKVSISSGAISVEVVPDKCVKNSIINHEQIFP